MVVIFEGGMLYEKLRDMTLVEIGNLHVEAARIQKARNPRG